MCQFLFGCGHLGNIPKTSLNLTLCPSPSNRGGIYYVQAPPGASHCKLTHADGRKWCHLSPAAVTGWLWCPLPRLITSSELLHKEQQRADERLRLAGCLITAEAAPPLSWKAAAAEEKPLSETWLGMWGVQDCWQLSLPFTLSLPRSPACMSPTEIWRRSTKRSRVKEPEEN